MVDKSGRKPENHALHSLRIGSASMLAARGDVSERVIQREGKWKSDAYKVYTRNIADDARQESRKLQLAKVCKDSQVKILYGIKCRSLGVTSVVEESIVLHHSVSQSSRNSHSRTRQWRDGDVFMSKDM